MGTTANSIDQMSLSEQSIRAIGDTIHVFPQGEANLHLTENVLFWILHLTLWSDQSEASEASEASGLGMLFSASKQLRCAYMAFVLTRLLASTDDYRCVICKNLPQTIQSHPLVVKLMVNLGIKRNKRSKQSGHRYSTHVVNEVIPYFERLIASYRSGKMPMLNTC